jgi:hypothetical protein
MDPEFMGLQRFLGMDLAGTVRTGISELFSMP